VDFEILAPQQRQYVTMSRSPLQNAQDPVNGWAENRAD